MYINKGIYTYIPIPDPETPKPEPRIPTGLPGYWRTIVRVIFLPVQKTAGYMIIIQEAGQKKGAQQVLYPEPRRPDARLFIPLCAPMLSLR